MKTTILNTLTVLLLLMAFAIPFIAVANEPDSVPVKELQEVTVSGNRILNKDGYQILLLDSRNRNFGTNALDAVSSLSMFQTNLNSDRLSAWDQSEVFILINGVPSTAIDLRAYKGSDIKNVEYYPVAPPQYMSFTDGPLINVVLKKRHDRFYSGYLNAVNSVTTGFGSDQIDLTYTDSLNQVKVGYQLNYRNIKNISYRSEYECLPEWKSSYDDNERYTGTHNSIYGSYQYYNTRHLFNAKLSFITNPLKQRSSGERSYSGSNENRREPVSTLLKSGNKSVSIDLYYNYMFGSGSIFCANVVNTFGRSHSLSEITSPVGGMVGSLVQNHTYSLVVNTFFISKILGWRYTVGSKYEYRQLRQEYSGKTDRPYSHKEFISIGLSRDLGYWTVAPTLALNVLEQSDGRVAKTSALPYMRLYIDWWPEGSLKGFSPQLTIMSRHTAPLLSMLTESYTYKDYRYVAVGNPYLKNFWDNSVRLDLCYFMPGRRDKVILRWQSNYIKNPIASILKSMDGMAYLQPQNLSHSLSHNLDLSITWYPKKWLEISPYMEYYANRYDASYRIRKNYLRYGGTVSATCDAFTFLLAANSPTREFDGDLIEDGSAQYAAKVQYKYRGWSFGAEYHYSGHNDRIYGKADDISVFENRDWKPLKTNIFLTATYSFSIGRSRSHGYKMLNEANSDNNGLNQYNTPKKPE